LILRRPGKVLLFGGCYSNLQATKALLRQAAALEIPPQDMICTGDICAYGADPAATFELLRAAGIACVMGNCEETLSTGAETCGCGFAPGSACDELAAQWYAYTAANIGLAERRAMAALPRRIELQLGDKKFAVLHGNAERINAFVFASASNLELLRQINLTGCDGIIAGHCGIPFTRRAGEKIWHNPGSIGMPANDGGRHGWFSIIEAVEDEVRITPVKLDYDFAGAASAMRAAGLPEAYAAALETGFWPSLDVLPAAERLRTGLALDAPRTVAIPEIAVRELTTLWVNTGTLCNLACNLCFMDSTPVNDALSYFPLPAFVDLLRTAPASVREIGFTGGEPFMNPAIIEMLGAALAAGKRVLVLTNAMLPMQHHHAALLALIARYPEHLTIRVSLDHYAAARHEALRGAKSFAPALAGLRLLARAGARLAVASRTPWGETEAMMRAGFARLFAAENIALDARDPARLTLFPEMDVSSPAPPVTTVALAALEADKTPMCASARMVVFRKNAAAPSVTPCTLLPGYDLGPDLAASLTPVPLAHPHCGQFCVFGGASCAGAPG
jgi:predicted phosphodiesterase/pyruvate-formate lyase-activating enzyme